MGRRHVIHDVNEKGLNPKHAHSTLHKGSLVAPLSVVKEVPVPTLIVSPATTVESVEPKSEELGEQKKGKKGRRIGFKEIESASTDVQDPANV